MKVRTSRKTKVSRQMSVRKLGNEVVDVVKMMMMNMPSREAFIYLQLHPASCSFYR